jgi:dTDP-4-dehydrorhamnose reductase
MTLLLIGGGGQLGSEIQARWNGSLRAPSRDNFDLLDLSAHARDIEEASAVINCAAFHNVDLCETNVGEAVQVNAVAVDALAAMCAERDIPFMTVSTDYVFDGEKRSPYVESDPPHPLSAYGVSKLAGELLVGRRQMKAFVVRTCGVYGQHASRSKGTFIDRIISQARNGERIRVVNDVVASPTYAGHLAEAMRSLFETGAYGLYHLSNTGAVTWYDFAKKALELAGIDHPIEPISAAEWTAPAARPAYSALVSEKLGRLGVTMPTWEEGIAAYLRDKAS